MGILSHNFLEVSLIFGEGIGADIVAVLYILCGLGIFLYGINRMGSSLKSIAGDKMRVIIEKSTNTPLKGMLVGFAATMLTQSASGTSAIIVSLVASLLCITTGISSSVAISNCFLNKSFCLSISSFP